MLRKPSCKEKTFCTPLQLATVKAKTARGREFFGSVNLSSHTSRKHSGRCILITAATQPDQVTKSSPKSPEQMPSSSSLSSFRSEETEENKRPLIEENDGYIPVNKYQSERRKYRRAIMLQWVLVGAFVLIILFISLSRNKTYYIPDELYCGFDTHSLSENINSSIQPQHKVW